jgi:hypothetical protein
MAKQPDVVLVVDVEATCWEGAPPEEEESEIICRPLYLSPPRPRRPLR